MNKAEIIDALYNELVTLYENANYYANNDNPMHNARAARDFEIRASEVCDIASTLFNVDLFDRYILAQLRN